MDQLLMRRKNLDNLPQLPELPPGYSLREARVEDAPSLCTLLRTAFADPRMDEGWVRRALLQAPDVKKVYVIQHDDAIVATASARLVPDQFPGSGYLHYVAVAPPERGRGLSEAVCTAVLHEFARLSCSDAVLETDDHRIAAIKIYQRLGFAPEHKHAAHIERWTAVADLLAAANL